MKALPLAVLVAVASLSSLAPTLSAATPPLLQTAVDTWFNAQEGWAFTQHVRMLNDDGSVKETRTERFDPSKPDNQRWLLLDVDGKTPTKEQRAKWQDRKNEKPRKPAKRAPQDYFDFENATLEEENKDVARYRVALNPEAARFVPVEKLLLTIAVNKRSKTIEQVTAGLKEPAKVALGLAKVTEVDLDLKFEEDEQVSAKEADREKKEKAARATRKKDDKDKKSDPKAPANLGGGGTTAAEGTARVVMSKLGDAAEYRWSDFQKVTLPAAAVVRP